MHTEGISAQAKTYNIPAEYQQNDNYTASYSTKAQTRKMFMLSVCVCVAGCTLQCRHTVVCSCMILSSLSSLQNQIWSAGKLQVLNIDLCLSCSVSICKVRLGSQVS